MKRTAIQPFSAQLTFGLEYGYTTKRIEEEDVIQYLQFLQKTLIETEGIYLSASISKSTIVLDNQVEPHLKISFINYPRFPINEDKLKSKIEQLTKQLMLKFEQNRTVIEYLDETIMLEQNINIDPRIQKR